MAAISVRVTTNEEMKTGSYEVKIFAGLNEPPTDVLKEALGRVEVSLHSIPVSQRNYPKYSDITKDDLERH